MPSRRRRTGRKVGPSGGRRPGGRSRRPGRNLRPSRGCRAQGHRRISRRRRGDWTDAPGRRHRSARLRRPGRSRRDLRPSGRRRAGGRRGMCGRRRVDRSGGLGGNRRPVGGRRTCGDRGPGRHPLHSSVHRPGIGGRRAVFVGQSALEGEAYSARVAYAGREYCPARVAYSGRPPSSHPPRSSDTHGPTLGRIRSVRDVCCATRWNHRPGPRRFPRCTHACR